MSDFLKKAKQGQKLSVIAVIGGAFQGKHKFATSLCENETKEIADDVFWRVMQKASHESLYNVVKREIACGAADSCLINFTDLPFWQEQLQNISSNTENPTQTFFSEAALLDFLQNLQAQNVKTVIFVLRECASGLLPLDRDFRAFQTFYNRTARLIVAQSQILYRVFAGIGNIIK